MPEYTGYRPSSLRAGDDDREASFTKEMALVQWANNWTVGEGRQKQIVAGWVVQQGKDPELDEVLAKVKYPSFVYRQGGANNTYWHITAGLGTDDEQPGTANFFFVILGLSRAQEMEVDRQRHGLGYGIHIAPDGGKRGKLNAIVFVKEFADLGYAKPCLLSAARITALNVITVLIRHYIAIDALDRLLKAKNENASYPPFYMVAVEITLGEDREYIDQATGKSSTSCPPWSTIPKGGWESDEDAKLWIGSRYLGTKKYQDIKEQIEAADQESGLTLIDEVIEWAQRWSDFYHVNGDQLLRVPAPDSAQHAAPAEDSRPAYVAPTPMGRRPSVPDPSDDIPF